MSGATNAKPMHTWLRFLWNAGDGLVMPKQDRRQTAMWLDRAKNWAQHIKQDVLALWIAARDPRTPIISKITAGAVAAYALSPIDLIPDFIPVFGYLDDLLIVPLGVVLAVRLIPAPLMIEFRAAAETRGRPMSKVGLAVVLAIWFLAAGAVFSLIWPIHPDE